MVGQPCPTGCGGTVKPGHLTCITCWHEIPGELRREVTRTWRALERIRGSARRNGKAYTLEAYRSARDAALASIR